jgi:membrane-associated phospholipid phosphatase
VRSLLARRLEADAALGVRLVAAGAATAAFVVPLLGLFLLVQDRWPPLLRLDEGAAQVLNRVAVSNPALVVALRAVSVVLDPWTFRLGAVVVVVVLARRRRDRLAVWVAVTVGGSGVVGLAAKHLFGRERPVLDIPVASAPGLSFPSGHALGSAVGLGVVLLLVVPRVAPRWRVPAVVAGGLGVLAVGSSRVGLGVHYVSDVVAGWLLGAAWLAATTIAFAIQRADRTQRVDRTQRTDQARLTAEAPLPGPPRA